VKTLNLKSIPILLIGITNNNNKGITMKVWMRLGIEFDATEEEMLSIKGSSDKMMELMKTKEISIVGNSYLPETGGLYDEEGEDIDEELYEKIHPDCDFEFDGNTFKIEE
jgi:hypothetical protein